MCLPSCCCPRYRDIFACCLRNGLQPNVTLWHFVAPQWFEELGGWTKEENVQLFVAYAVRAVRLFGDQVGVSRRVCSCLWCMLCGVFGDKSRV